MKTYLFHLPYHKQGDDLSWAQSQAENEEHADAAALRLHAKMLRDSAEMLEKAAVFAEKGHLKIGAADTHHIDVNADAEAARELGLEEMDFDDEDDEGDELEELESDDDDEEDDDEDDDP
jgi:hypothetical protein